MVRADIVAESCHRGDLKVLIDRLIVGGQAVDLADGCLHASIFQEGDQVPQDGGFSHCRRSGK